MLEISCERIGNVCLLVLGVEVERAKFSQSLFSEKENKLVQPQSKEEFLAIHLSPFLCPGCSQLPYVGERLTVGQTAVY